MSEKTVPAFTSSWLVQRLARPVNAAGPLASNPFSFGGGLKNGGLSDEAMELLLPIFEFDYMGAAEFEFGAVPKALQRLANLARDEALTSFEITIAASEVLADFRPRGRSKKHSDGEHTVYVLAPEAWREEVTERIRLWARHDGTAPGATLKEWTLLPQVLRSEDHNRLCGWLELDNGFMFFTDREMWAKTCELFEVSAEAEGVTS